MAIQRNQAWLTCVHQDDAVLCALVLAESLRKTRTTRRIGVVISSKVSQESTKILQKRFDDVFLYNDYLAGSNEQLSGKIFALSLEMFEKCVFAQPSSIVLENCDILFKEKGPEVYKNFSGDCEMFRFAPNLTLCEYLQHSCQQNGFDNEIVTKQNGFSGVVEDWLKNNGGSRKDELRDKSNEVTILKFSLATGHFHLVGNEPGQPLIAQFTEIPKTDAELVDKMKKFHSNPTLGLTERALVREWLNVLENQVAPVKGATRSRPNRNADAFKSEPIAIIGISCRFPGAANLEEFWDLLYAGEESICQPPAFRWRKEQAIYGCGKQRKTEAGFLNVPVDAFDSKFFGMSPKDAELLDPQARLLHEVMWEGLENSGTDPQSLYGSHTGIFTGSWMNDYKDIIQASTERDFFRTYMGNSIGATAARLSFLLGLTGPCIATESGCSSAIVALDLAVKSLRNGEINLAIAGGVNLLLHPFESNIIDYVIAPNGRCKTFDEKADGFGRAEGGAVLILKRLSDALRDRDNIWALIRGSAVSQEGLSRSLGTPTVHCEALAMELALKDGGLRPEQVSFVEAHGTGTTVGDPMEVAAIAKAYHSPARKEPLVIGSVKTNIGHTESCSGIAGIIKTVLAMHHELIPKHLNLDTLNPQVNLEAIPGKIPLEPIAWPKVPGQPRRAGVSSFGISGTDGHVIIEEPPSYTLPKFTVGLEKSLHLIKFSAKTNEALDELLKLYSSYFREQQSGSSVKFPDAAYSANMGRASFTHRAFLLASSYEEAANALEAQKVVRGEVTVTSDSAGKICFLFTGQGSQYPGMAKLLYDSSPVFRVHFDQCDALLKANHNLSIRQVLWESDDAKKSKELSRTIYCQTSIFVIEYCLLKLWESWGIKPDYVLGHSLGEFCAAVAAGVLTFEDALMLVAERSRLIDTLPRGSMLVIKASRDEVVKLMATHKIDLDWAALNSSTQTVVAGDTEKVVQFLDVCKSKGKRAIILEASHAFHSRHMDPMLKEYRKIAETVKKASSVKCQFISGMKGCVIKEPIKEITAEYWVQQTREKVSFRDACKALRQLECEDYLEVGPQPVISSFVLENIEDISVSSFPSLRRNTNDWDTILTSLGKLYLKGYKINWQGFDSPYPREKVPTLPYYPFNRKSYWVDCHHANESVIHPLVGLSVASATHQSIFQNDITLKTVPYLKDHCIGHMVVFPGAAFTEMCLTAGYCAANSYTEELEKPTRSLAVENVKIEAPLEIKEGKFRRLQTIVNFVEGDSSDKASGFECKVYHQNQSEEADAGSTRNWVLHASALFHPFVSATTLLEKWNTDSKRVTEIMSSLEATPTETFYKSVDSTGLKFGESFRALEQFWYNPQDSGLVELVAEMRCPAAHEKYLLHPLIIDTMMQVTIMTAWRTMQDKADKGSTLRVPVRIGKLTLLNNIPVEQNDGKLYLYVKCEGDENVSVVLCTTDLTPIAVMDDLELFETNVKTIQSVLESQNSRIPDSWEETWKTIHGPFDKNIILASVEPVFSEEKLHKDLEVAEQLTTLEDVVHIAQINRLLYLYTLKALFQLGWTPKQGETFNVSILSEKFKILPVFSQQMRYFLKMFEQEPDNMLGVTSEVENDGNQMWMVSKVCADLQEKVEAEIDTLYQLLKQVPKLAITVDIYRNLAIHLHEFLAGSASVLPLLYPVEGEDNYAERQKLSAENYYNYYPGRVAVAAKIKVVEHHLLTYLRALNEANSGQQKRVFRILEVGAGTCSMTSVNMPLIKEILGTDFEYYFTDISAAFFTKAEKKFEDVKDFFKFSTFNVEEPAMEQGIPLNYFDIVMASNVLHATKSLRVTLRNLRQTLRPRGVLFFTDTFSEMKDRGLTFAFGLLEGYWLFEDFDVRPEHSCVDANTWKKLLLQEGFDFVHTVDAYLGVMGCVTGVATEQRGYDLRVELITNETRKWVVFAPENDADLDKAIAAMAGAGYSINVVKPGSELQDEEKLAKMIQETIGAPGKVQGMIYAWGVERSVVDQREIALPFMHIAKCLLSMNKPPKLYVLTRGVQSLTDVNVELSPSGGMLFGMSKSLKNENSELFVRIVDLEIGNAEAEEVNQILFEVAMNKDPREKERLQVTYRDNVRYEPRFSAGTLAQNAKTHDLQLPPCAERYQLVLPKTKVINDLSFDVLLEEPVGEDEVEVQTKAYALNFRDILTVLKPITEFDNYNNVGLDFAGVVTKVGRNVPESQLKVGDRVFGLKMKQSPLPSHVVVEAESLIRIPETFTFSEAATLPAVFATSFYCLFTVGRMKKGDYVLIHTGSGGVGLSAIQLAQEAGAKIITTAGNPRKRAYLRSLGIKHVFHSRNTSYKEDIFRVTNGRGVDIILNSLTGPGFKEATLAVCAKNGRFIEMSRLSVWTTEEVKQLRPDVEYTLVDLTRLDRTLWKNLLESIKTHLEKGRVKPIPFIQFDGLRIRQALQVFQKAKHIGKLVVTMPEQKAAEGQWKVKVTLFNQFSTYLITGGLGGIGFEVCKWMLERGAIDIVLIGRNPPRPNVAHEIERLNRKGYNVMVRLADVGNEEQIKAVIDEIASNYKPIRGIQHCAGVLLDNMYTNQTWSSFEQAFQPKVRGTWNLHNFTKGMPLEHFIMYSSITAMVGTPSQANHAAANCFEDAFAHYRHSLGLPATTINWGQWGEVGVAREVNVSGALPVSVARMLNGLEEVLRSQLLQVSIGEFESLTMWNMVCPSFRYYLDERLLKTMNDGVSQHTVMLNSDQFWREMDEVDEKEGKMEVVMMYIKSIIRSALRMEPDEPIGNDVNIKDLGVDSLMLIELKNSIQGLLGSRLTVTANMLQNCVTIRNLGEAIIDRLLSNDTEEHELIDVEPLSPEELLQLLKNDSILEENIQAPTQVTKVTSAKSILVTGSTGQLGPYVLSSLCQIAPSVDKIYCLIRTKPEKCPRKKLESVLEGMKLLDKVEMDKVECLKGDICKPEFGLEKEKYAELANSVDAVVHLAAKCNHLESYRKVETDFQTGDIRSVNVGGILNVLRFASCSKTKHIYYASSIICIFGGNLGDGVLCDNWPEPEEMSILAENKIMGYAISKWVNEMLLKQAVARGIPCKAFRFPWIMGETETGRIDFLQSHCILRFMSYLKIKAMPRAPLPALMLPVDTCAELSMKVFWKDETPSDVYNIIHPNPQLEVEFVALAKEEFGTTIELVDLQSQEHREKLCATGMPLENFKSIYEDANRTANLETSMDFRAIQGFLLAPEHYFKNEKLNRILPGFSESLLSTMEVLKRNLVYVRNNGFFKKFAI